MKLPDSLLDNYRVSLAKQAASLRAIRAVDGGGPGGLSADGRRSVRAIGHRLRGTGTSYGFPEISQAAGAVETVETADLDASVDQLLAVIDAVTGSRDASPSESLVEAAP